MALANYNDLLEAVARWLNKRSLDGRAADFITLAETDFQSKLRTREMHAKSQAPVTCPATNLPPDWLEAISLWIEGHSRALDFATPDEMPELRAIQNGPPGCPTRYGLGDNVIELAPVPTEPVTLWMSYYARVPRLSVTAPTNWLTTRDIGVYLYGALVQAAPYMLDDARVAVWDKQYSSRIAQLNMSSVTALHSGGPLVRRRRGYGRGVNPVPWSGYA